MSPEEVKQFVKFFNLQIPFSDGQLKTAYRDAAKKWHPDINKSPGAEDVFKRVNMAYDYFKINIDIINRVNPRPANPTFIWPNKTWSPENKTSGVDPFDQFKKDAANTPRADDSDKIKLYRGPYSGIPYAIEVPREFMKSGGVVYAMVSFPKGQTFEFRFTVTPDAGEFSKVKVAHNGTEHYILITSHDETLDKRV